MSRYVLDGKLHKGNKIFIETELDDNNDPRGTYIDDIINKIPENAKVEIVIDYEDELDEL